MTDPRWQKMREIVLRALDLEDRFTSLIGQGLVGTIQSSSRERRPPVARAPVLRPFGV